MRLCPNKWSPYFLPWSIRRPCRGLHVVIVSTKEASNEIKWSRSCTPAEGASIHERWRGRKVSRERRDRGLKNRVGLFEVRREEGKGRLCCHVYTLLLSLVTIHQKPDTLLFWPCTSLHKLVQTEKGRKPESPQARSKFRKSCFFYNSIQAFPYVLMTTPCILEYTESIQHCSAIPT